MDNSPARHFRLFDKRTFVTPAARRIFDGDVVQNPEQLQPCTDAMKAVGVQLGVGVIDLHTATINLYNQLGPVQSQTQLGPSGSTDTTHFSQHGAEVLAQMIADRVPAATSELTPYLMIAPEPGSLSLLATGSLALLVYAWRKWR